MPHPLPASLGIAVEDHKTRNTLDAYGRIVRQHRIIVRRDSQGNRSLTVATFDIGPSQQATRSIELTISEGTDLSISQCRWIWDRGAAVEARGRTVRLPQGTLSFDHLLMLIDLDGDFERRFAGAMLTALAPIRQATPTHAARPLPRATIASLPHSSQRLLR